MSLTRSRSQARLDFPARKSLRRTRTKTNLKIVEDMETVQPSGSKRNSADDALVETHCSPSKRSRGRNIDNIENAGVSSPARPLTPRRDPLTPRKDGILTPSDKDNIMRTPVRSVLTALPSTDNSSTTEGILSPMRALDFSSKENCLSPAKKSSRIDKCQAASFDSPTKIRSSPRKSIGTPRPNDQPMMSPLRLARQEGLCYQKAKQALNTAMPARLVCREAELETVNTFLQKYLYQGKPGSLYISGAPGTGKTAILTRVMEKLTAEKQELVYVNCMSLRNSQAIYNSILTDLRKCESSLTAKHAQADLEALITSKSKPVVLVLDEMDQLDSKNQEILYTIFEWPSLSRSRLVLIGIANALDLTDRILPRLQALPKCKPQLLNFPPYTRDQIVQVLQERLNEVELEGQVVLETSALKFCASKVAAIAGDMRKALDVCRRAIELVENDVRKQKVLDITMCRSPTKRPPIKKIGVPHILKIVNEVYGSRMVQQSGAAQTIPLQQKLAICSLLLLVKNGKSKEITAGKLHETFNKVCQKQNVAKIDQSEFFSICSLIDSRGIFNIKKSKEARSAKISLKLDERELESALQDKTLLSSVLHGGL